MIEDKQAWYMETQFSLKPEEEEKYFEQVNHLIFVLHTLELRLSRHRELSALRYDALRTYLYADHRLKINYNAAGAPQRQDKDDEMHYSLL